MSFTIPTFEQIRAALLRDVKNLLPDAATTTDSDAYVRASSVASAVEGLYQHQAWMARQILPDTADTAYLELHASLRGITRKAATTATGTLTVIGTAGAEVPASTLVRHVATGATFSTTAAITVGEGGDRVLAHGPRRRAAAGLHGLAATAVNHRRGAGRRVAVARAGGLAQAVRPPAAGGIPA
jgi:uncharacterized phage protein gp47/JayE